MAYFVGTDVGGTFTDLWVSESSGQTRVFKTPTTKDVLSGVVAESLFDRYDAATQSYRRVPEPDRRWKEISVQNLLEHRGGWDRKAVSEAHPESSFVELAGSPLRTRKSTPEGREERIQLLSRSFPDVEEHLGRNRAMAVPPPLYSSSVPARESSGKALAHHPKS